ncbi:hypothetical protein A3G06_00195 [Candidatus Nomurabacteria bacterium RIFCSPLOWO2_12_FULL_46_14]|uniref:Uncharacterized protein n=1 Tax=Candidatus Nomurabacteria bacterium RIFCSPLOWO2_12_FULL_46_14 TaxID=1801797 RepID=A0A1F6Y8X5_9BACT|nr:MAG: hypothetical protein A3G06_00195 [Candidatus Nomurabacteria bacterium RIFCSPLOWO2_12_FULL_46_14]
MNKSLIISIVILLIVAAAMVYALRMAPLPIFSSPEKERVFCTMEAKLCPDGSYVGRTGPNCEFTLCP